MNSVARSRGKTIKTNNFSTGFGAGVAAGRTSCMKQCKCAEGLPDTGGLTKSDAVMLIIAVIVTAWIITFLIRHR
jgi:hypothetical protein